MRSIVYMVCLLISVRPMAAQSPTTHAGFEKLKSVAGKWRGQVTSPYGPSGVTLEYEVISGGAALMERLTFENSPTMVSVYHPDGRQLMMTHFCSSANQPRVRTRQTEWSANSREFEFHYLDATNVLSSDQMHIERLTLLLNDKNHLVQKWSDGKLEVIVTVEREGSATSPASPPASPAPASPPASPAPASPAASPDSR